MSTGRMIARAAVSAAASLALVTGVGAGTTAVAAEPTAAQQCQVETQEVRDARQKVKKLKKKLRKAKRALSNAKGPAAERKAEKRVKRFKKRLRRAKADLRTQRAEKTEWCDRAEQEQSDALTAAMNELNQRITEFTAMQSSGDVEALPTEVSGPMEAAFGELLVHLESLKTQLPTADVAGLQSALVMLQGLDPAALQTAVAQLATEIESSGDPSALQTLVDGLIGGVPGADGGGMEEVQAAFEALVAQLQALEPQTAGAQLPSVTDKVLAALQALQNHSTLLQQIIDALTTLNGGTMPSDPSTVEALLTDLLTLLASGTSLEDAVGDLLGAITDPLDPITDPLDPILDPILDLL